MIRPVGKAVAAVALCGVILGVLGGAEMGKGTTGAEPGFCSRSVVRDYGLPFPALPPPTSLFEPGGIPFGPADLDVSGVLRPWAPIVYPGETVGYRFSNLSGTHSIELDSVVMVAVSRIEPGGALLPTAFSETVTVGTLAASPGSGSEAWVKSKPLVELGAYRVDLAVEDQSSGQRVEYGEYVRVAPKRFQVRLKANVTTANPGARVVVRLENLGTVVALYGLPVGVERFVDGDWEVIPQGPTALPLYNVKPGLAGRCSTVNFGDDPAPGLYRISKRVDRFPGPHKRVIRRNVVRLRG